MTYDQWLKQEEERINWTEKIPNQPKFKLICSAGSYEAESLSSLIWEVLKHRFWHLRTHGKWMD